MIIQVMKANVSRENRHHQMTLFGIVHQMPVVVKKMLDKSWSPAFRKLVFDKLNENVMLSFAATLRGALIPR